MKHLSVDKLKNLFKNRLDAEIDSIAKDSDALGLFAARDLKDASYYLISVGRGYPCTSLAHLLHDSKEAGCEIIAGNVFTGRNDSTEDTSQNSATRSLSDPDKEAALDARENQLKRRESTLRRREQQVLQSEEQLKRIAEQQMEDIARKEMN